MSISNNPQYAPLEQFDGLMALGGNAFGSFHADNHAIKTSGTANAESDSGLTSKTLAEDIEPDPRNVDDTKRGSNSGKSALELKEPSGDNRRLNDDEKAQAPLLSSIDDWCLLDPVYILLSAAILACLIILLKVHDERPQPDWSGMSLNTVVAWLSTISKALMMLSVSRNIGQLKWTWFASSQRPLFDLQEFDAASRGALGSLQLLSTSKLLNVQSLGCLATLLAIGFSPFTQNMVNVYPRSIADAKTAAWISNSSYFAAVGPFSGGSVYMVDPVIKANVYNSLFNSNPSQPWATPEFTCLSGNCTFPPVATLSAHTSCENIANLLSTSCRTQHFEASNFTSENCTLSVPGGTSLSFVTGLGGQSIVIGSTRDGVFANQSYFDSVQYIMLKEFERILAHDYEYLSPSRSFQATECKISLCVDVVQSAVNLTEYSESILASWCGGGLRDNFDVSPDWEERTKELGYPGNSTPVEWGSGLYLPLGFDFFDKRLLQGASTPPGWAISLTISTFITHLFSGSYHTISDAAQWRSNELIGTSLEGMYATRDALQAVYYGNLSRCGDQDDHLTCAITNVGKALSKSLRDQAYVSANNFSQGNATIGQTWVITNYVRIDWPWISLPLAIWTLSVVLWASTFFKSKAAGIPQWGNNLLPLLYLEKQSRSSGIPQVGTSNGALAQVAKQHSARLRVNVVKMHLLGE